MLASPARKQGPDLWPDLWRGLEISLEHAHAGLADKDAWKVAKAAARIVGRADALPSVVEKASRLEEAVKKLDFETATHILADLEAEVESNRPQ